MLKKIWYYIKDFLERCVFGYKHDKSYRKVCYTILLSFMIFNVIYFCLYLYLNHFFNIKIWWIAWFLISLFICFLRFLRSINFIPPDYVQPNIDKLPEKIGKYPVVIQYDPPKWLSPSEVWLLYALNSFPTNIDCLLYKREYEGLVKIEDKDNWEMLVQRLKEIEDKVPEYESWYRSAVFWVSRLKEVTWNTSLGLWSRADVMEMKKIHLKLLYHCVDKWWIIEKKNNFYVMLLVWFIFCFVLSHILPSSFAPLYIFLMLLFMVNIVVSSLSWKWMYIWKKILRTDEWDKLLAHIIWYKYWLEKCEEEQVKKIIKDEPWFKSRNMPYIIALRMDWKLLDKKFNK